MGDAQPYKQIEAARNDEAESFFDSSPPALPEHVSTCVVDDSIGEITETTRVTGSKSRNFQSLTGKEALEQGYSGKWQQGDEMISHRTHGC